MQVKWGWIRPGSLAGVNWSTLTSVTGGHLGKMWNYDAVSGPKGGAMDGYPMPKDMDVIIVGGRSSIAEAMRKHGPAGWHSKLPIFSYGAYCKSGSFRDPNLTMLLLRTTQTRPSGTNIKDGPRFDIKFANNNVDTERYFIPPAELADFVKTL